MSLIPSVLILNKIINFQLLSNIAVWLALTFTHFHMNSSGASFPFVSTSCNSTSQSHRQEGVNISYKCSREEKIRWILRCLLASCLWHHYSSGMAMFHAYDPPAGTNPSANTTTTHAENNLPHSQLPTGCLTVLGYLCLGQWHSQFAQLLIFLPSLHYPHWAFQLHSTYKCISLLAAA